ncbi:MAG: hypothetical protein NC086_01570, partial [Alistipes sp.]|nr:hypothetical protein [Alistipes sp.]
SNGSEPKTAEASVSEDEYNNNRGSGGLVLEPLIILKYRISQQPEASNVYTVKGEEYMDGGAWKETEDIAYQWYKAEVNEKTYVVGEEDSADEIAVYEPYATYDPDKRIWRSSDTGAMSLKFSAKADDVVKVTVHGGNFEGFMGVIDGDSDFVEVTGENGVFAYTAKQDSDNFTLVIDNASADSKQFTCSVAVERTEITATAVEGQTSATFTKGVDGGHYFCECTFNPSGDKAKINTEFFTYRHEHVWSEDYESDKDGHWHVCEQCGEAGEKSSHAFTEKVTKQPTCTQTGIRTFTCAQCKKEKTEEIGKTGHKYEAGVCTVCGEKDPSYVSGGARACVE